MQWLHCGSWPVLAAVLQLLDAVLVLMVLLNTVVNGDTDGSCWGGGFRVEDDCSSFCSLFIALAGCDLGQVCLH